MNTEQRTGIKKREIIEAAISLFQECTVKKTSMDDVAKSANASKVTVYKYFTDKEGLYRSVFSYISAAYDEEIASKVMSQPSLIKKMMNYIDVYSEFISSGRQCLCDQLSAQCREAGNDYAAFQKNNERLVRDLINQAKVQGFIDSSVEGDIAYHYINMGFSYFQHNALYRSRVQSDRVFRESFMSFIWRNILKSDTPLQ